MFNEYKELVQSHATEVKRMEEMGRLATMLLPVSRFGKYSEVFQESTYSVLGLVSLFHDRIIHGAKNEMKDKLGKMVRLMITIVTHTEVVMEMLARLSGGEALREKLIVIVEWFKAFGRLFLLIKTRAGQVLVSGGQLESNAKDNKEEMLDLEAANNIDNNETSSGPEIVQLDENDQEIKPEEEKNEKPAKWVGKRSGKSLKLPPALESFDNSSTNDDSLKNDNDLEKQMQQHTAKKLVNNKNNAIAGPEDALLRMVGEVIHIIRPVIYVAHLNRTTNKKSWSPWLLSLGLEMLSMRCSSVAVELTSMDELSTNLPKEEIIAKAMKKLINGKPGKQYDKATSEEFRRRRTLFAFYLMRSPLFDRLTLPTVERFAGGLSSLPKIGPSMQAMLIETLMYYHRNHFYISGS